MDVTRQMIRAALAADATVSHAEGEGVERILRGEFVDVAGDKLLTLGEAAERLGVSRTTMWRMRAGKSRGPVRMTAAEAVALRGRVAGYAS